LDILDKLGQGNKIEAHQINEAVEKVMQDLSKFNPVFDSIFSDNALLQLRSPQVIIEVAKSHPDHLQNRKQDIIQNLDNFKTSEIRWYMAILVGMIDLEGDEVAKSLDTLLLWLDQESHKFVKVNCMQGLADIAIAHPELKEEVKIVISEEMEKGSASIKARGRKLLKMLR